MNCSEFSQQMAEIHAKVGSTYNGIFVTSRDEITRIISDIKAKVGDAYPVEAIECYVYEYLSLGELTPLLMNDNLEEIMVVAKGLPVYVYDRRLGMKATDIYIEEEKVRQLIKKIANYVGRKVDANSPLLDARLPDGSRVNATLPSVSPRGSTITIRKFRREPLTIADLIRYGTLNSFSAAFLWLAVDGMRVKPANLLIIGGTASGKTTTLNALSTFIPEDERIISIEDVLEISLMHEHWIPMETRPPDTEGNEITMDDLLKNALRMRPDRIIVGEVRASEALTLFTAMNTGHDGCMATLHANSAKETLSRLKSHPMNVPNIMIPALNFIVAQKRQVEKGKLRRIVFEIVEISGTEGDNILTNTLFKYNARSSQLEEVLLSGRYLEELSTLSNLSLKELKEEIYGRAELLEVIVDKNLSNKDIHRIVQLYYRNPERALDKLMHTEEESSRPRTGRGLLGI